MDILGGHDENDPPSRTPMLPYIWFPWYGEFDYDKVKNDVLAEFNVSNKYHARPLSREVFGHSDEEYQFYLKSNIWKHKKLPRSWIKDEIEVRTPDIIVQSGDYIAVDHAEMNLIRDDPFAPLGDKAGIHLFVNISNDNGLIKVLDKPIVLYGRQNLHIVMRINLFMLSSVGLEGDLP
jgi:hypothetical protein